MTLYVIVGDEPEPRPISIQVTPFVANKLGHALVGAALEVEKRSG
jgi:hypothetical protein